MSFTLERLCLKHLRWHLEDYPLEALASLPLHLRRRLLLSLPAVDICQLEDTPVTEGVDIGSIWRGVEKQLEGRPACLSSSSLTIYVPRLTSRKLKSVWVRDYSSSASSKLEFVENTLSHFFSGHIRATAERLFIIRGHVSAPVDFPPGSPYRKWTPPRHIKCSNEELFVIQVLSTIINQCKVLPERLSFRCNELADTDMWKKQNAAFLSLFSKLMSETQSLSFHGGGYDVRCLGIPRSILELLFSQPKPVLTSLSLYGCPEFVLCAVADATLFFSQACCTQNLDQTFFQSLYPQLLSCPLPYSRLTTLSIDINGYDKSKQHVLYEQVNSILLYQKGLESVTLSSFTSTSHASALKMYTTLGKLFYEPQFKALSLQDLYLHWKDLGALIPPFLASPISPGRQQELCFLDSGLHVLGPPPSVAANFNGCSILPGKVLRLEHILYHDQPKPFIEWLSELNVPDSLSFFTFSIDEGVDLLEVFGTVMSLFKDKSSAALLESFSVESVPLFCETSPEIPFNHLFSATRLKQVSLTQCIVYKNLPVITQGLLKQVPHGALEDLCLDLNELGTSSSEEFQEFADTIFLLPQLRKLSLKRNSLSSNHFTLLYAAWRCSRRAPIYTLDICGNDYEDNEASLRQVAANGDFIHD